MDKTEMELTGELERISRHRRLMEPLAVLFERFVAAAESRPQDVYLGLTDGPEGTVVLGESLEAAHEIWTDLKGLERHLKAALCLPSGMPKVAAPEGTVMERKFTGTYRGRQRDLMKL